MKAPEVLSVGLRKVLGGPRDPPPLPLSPGGLLSATVLSLPGQESLAGPVTPPVTITLLNPRDSWVLDSHGKSFKDPVAPRNLIHGSKPI